MLENRRWTHVSTIWSTSRWVESCQILNSVHSVDQLQLQLMSLTIFQDLIPIHIVILIYIFKFETWINHLSTRVNHYCELWKRNELLSQLEYVYWSHKLMFRCRCRWFTLLDGVTSWRVLKIFFAIFCQYQQNREWISHR